MEAKIIKAENFRNIESATVEFTGGVNLLYGNNAQGKTNLLEAVFYASVGRSFRATATNEMISFGKKSACVSGDYLCDKKEKSDLVRTIEKGAEKRGTPFGSGVASYLISCVGSDLNTVINETDKLCSYAKGRTVTNDDVDALCPKTLEAKVFDITKALHAGRFSVAQQKLSNVIAQKEDPLMILGAFIMSYTDMYRVRAAVTAGKRAEDVAKLYNYSGKVFRLTNAQRESHGLSLSSIYSCIELLAEADRMMKSSSVSKTLILEQTLARLAIYEGNDR